MFIYICIYRPLYCYEEINILKNKEYNDNWEPQFKPLDYKRPDEIGIEYIYIYIAYICYIFHWTIIYINII